MASSVLVDASFLVALLSRRDANHSWATAKAPRLPPPWMTCEAVLSEAFHLRGRSGAGSFSSLLQRGAVMCDYHFADDIDSVLKLLQKYADVPMSFADACLVRMPETLDDHRSVDHRRGFSYLSPAWPPNHSMRAAALS